MGLSNEGATYEVLLVVNAAANTAAATSAAAIDITPYEGFLEVTQTVGVVTAGTIDGALQECDDAGMANPVALSGQTFPQVTTANDPLTQTILVPLGRITKPFLRYVGTIATGPAVVGVTFRGKKKYI